MRTLIIDNYDSFTYNIVHAVAELGGEPVVFKNDEISIDEIAVLAPTHIIISPGPGGPDKEKDFGICEKVIREFSLKAKSPVPILGVCLGHQGLAHVLGASIIHAPTPVHGKTSEICRTDMMPLSNSSHARSSLEKWPVSSSIQLTPSKLFKNLPQIFTAMRYHSLVIDDTSLPDTLRVTARTNDADQLIMAVEHISLPLYGIQFHPESISTPTGLTLLRNFLEIRQIVHK